MVNMSSIIQCLDGIDLAYNAVQAGLTTKANSSYPLFNRLQKHCTTFLMIDVLSLMYTGMKLINEVICKYKASQHLLHCWALGVSIGVLGVGMLGSYLVDKVFRTTIQTKYESCKSAPPTSEQNKQYLYMIRSTVNIGLCLISSASPIVYFSAALEIYSAAQLAMRKWIQTVSTIIPDDFECRKITAIYNFLFFPAKNNVSDTCSICLDENKPVDTYFCENHTFHQKCLISYINTKAKSFFNSFGNFSWERTSSTNRDGVTSYRATYHTSLPKSTIPCCPLCRNLPPHNEFIIHCKDRLAGNSPTKIDWKD